MPLKFAAVAVVLAVAVISGCATNPATGAPELVLMSEKKEIEIGAQMHREIVAKNGLNRGQDLQDYVNGIGQELAAVSERPDLDFTFTVLDDDTVNAFALPGGYIYVTRGLLAHLKSEAELAAVLGHEIGHVTARHAVSRDRQNKLLGALGIASAIATGSTVASEATNIVGQGVVSRYGRQQELQADELGATYIAKVGYPSDAAANSIEVIKRKELFELEQARLEGRKANVYHGFFATHPDNDTRLREIVDAAANIPTAGERGYREEEYLKRIDGLRYGPKGRAGVTRGNTYYHGGFRIKLRFPEGWRVEDQRSQLVAVAPDNATTLNVYAIPMGRDQSPEEALKGRLRVQALESGRSTTIDGLPAYIATAKRWESPHGPRPARVAIIVNPNRRVGYVFAGSSKTDLSRIASDSDYIATIFKFERMKSRQDLAFAQAPRLKVVQVKDGQSIDTLSKTSAIPNYPRQQLRLLNGLYPAGEPEPGDVIKIVE